MSSIMGEKLKISIFGQSHSEAIGCVIDGLPAGIKLDMEKISAFMARRTPGNSPLSTTRKEADTPRILSGVVDSYTCGAPLCMCIENTDTRSSDYADIKKCPRPSHSDYPYFIKTDGFNDIRGGGHSSGRLTAPLCFAGAIAIEILKEKGIEVVSHIKSVGDICDRPFDPTNIEAPIDLSFPVLDVARGAEMKELIESVSKEGDSVGGVIECAITGVSAGLGDPMFDGIENRIAKNIFAVPAVKGIEFGSGFDITRLKGSQAADCYFYDENGNIKTKTNHNGGILGGITNGMPIVFSCAVKPTPSILKPQETIDLEARKNTVLTIRGRHDPCIVLRAVPVVESVAALTILDMII